MPQKLQTSLILDAVLSDGYKGAFSSANKLMGDLNKQGNALEKELRQIGKGADDLDKVGKSSVELRHDMVRLERQIKETNRAVGKFGDAKRHFRNASIGAKTLQNDLRGIGSLAKTTGLAVAGIGLGAGYATLRGVQDFSKL